jgi:nicotinamide-nucleotide amidase
MNAAIISIGDELLIGQVINSNAAYIAERCNLNGIDIKNILTVGDDIDDIIASFDKYFPECDILITTGGLGPTHDDITRTAICEYFSTKLMENADVKENVKRILALRNIKWTSAADNQSLVPEGCKVIPNKHGTAAGMVFEKGNKYLIVMPGVPFEMKSMVDDFLIPFFKSLNPTQAISHRTLNTTGITESALSDLLGDIEQLTSGASLAFLPAPTGVKLRITHKGYDNQEVLIKLNEIENKIRDKVGNYIYGAEDEDIENIVGNLLSKNDLTIAVAESCTGGLIADRITNVSGASKYFDRGVVTYSNKSKIELLGIPEGLITKHGAVSREVAEAMASGIKNGSHSNIGISTTGIAGPSGGTNEKPVGLVWIGYSNNKITFAEKFLFGDDRLRTKIRASQAALNIVRKKLLGI